MLGYAARQQSDTSFGFIFTVSTVPSVLYLLALYFDEFPLSFEATVSESVLNSQARLFWLLLTCCGYAFCWWLALMPLRYPRLRVVYTSIYVVAKRWFLLSFAHTIPLCLAIVGAFPVAQLKFSDKLPPLFEDYHSVAAVSYFVLVVLLQLLTSAYTLFCSYHRAWTFGLLASPPGTTDVNRMEASRDQLEEATRIYQGAVRFIPLDFEYFNQFLMWDSVALLLPLEILFGVLFWFSSGIPRLIFEVIVLFLVTFSCTCVSGKY
jgi:hypothetical protein